MLLIDILAIYNKFLFIKLDKVLSIDLAMNLKSLIALLAFDNIICLPLSLIIAKIEHYQEGVSKQKQHRRIKNQ